MMVVTTSLLSPAVSSKKKNAKATPGSRTQDSLGYSSELYKCGIGLCENNAICEHLCFNLHDGTFECDCQRGYTLEPDGYSCTTLLYRNVALAPGSPILQVGLDRTDTLDTINFFLCDSNMELSLKYAEAVKDTVMTSICILTSIASLCLMSTPIEQESNRTS
ncbi:hypothetical protein SK128_027746 [Halocaridina rubra]|uniref:EGF-like domain-containing protein n=1 Tax=Halocaridina rubra TaxID=373956 RepID=A0AAN9AGS6_HALRR